MASAAQKKALEFLATKRGWSRVGRKPLNQRTITPLLTKGWVEIARKRGGFYRGSDVNPGDWEWTYEDWKDVRLTSEGEVAAVKLGIRKPFEERLEKAKRLAERWVDSPKDAAKWESKARHLSSLLGLRMSSQVALTWLVASEHLAARKRKPSIDSVVTFKHKGVEVIATAERTSWSPAGMVYFWKTDDGKRIETQGMPKDVEVLVDPAARRKRAAARGLSRAERKEILKGMSSAERKRWKKLYKLDMESEKRTEKSRRDSVLQSWERNLRGAWASVKRNSGWLNVDYPDLRARLERQQSAKAQRGLVELEKKRAKVEKDLRSAEKVYHEMKALMKNEMTFFERARRFMDGYRPENHLKYVGASLSRRDKFVDYYRLKPRTPVREVVRRWVEEVEKPYDPHVQMYSLREVWPHREYSWSAKENREGPDQWSAIVDFLSRKGWDPKEPAIMIVGSDGSTKLGEGNHRLAAARELGIRQIPMRFIFVEGRVTKNPQRGYGKSILPDPPPPPRPKPSRTTPVTKEEEKQVDDIMDLLFSR